MSDNLPAFTDDNFDAEVASSEIPVLVDFGATWCGPCRMLAPIVEKLAGEFDGRMKIGAVDIDKARQTATKFGIMQVPTLLFFKNGEVVDKITGLQPEAALRKRIETVLTA